MSEDQAFDDKMAGIKRIRCPHCEYVNARPAKFLEQYEGTELIFTCDKCRQRFEVTP
jgi:RNase P subunit RPR2